MNRGKMLYGIKMNDGSVGLLQDFPDKKRFIHRSYNFVFDKKTGYHVRFGKTLEDDGVLELGLPEIADIEISTVCNGVPNIGPCKFCYKGNAPVGHNMDLETFKKVFHNLPKTVTQIAFGIGDIDGNPDMKAIFQYTLANGVIPNVTINGAHMTPEWFDFLSDTCGAVAVSVYDEDLSFGAVYELNKRGMKQVNIHYMICEERFTSVVYLVDNIKTDKRLKGLNALVLLGLKNKGRAETGFTPLTQSQFSAIANMLMSEGINFGFDSCTAGKVAIWAKEFGHWEVMKDVIEPCESTVYSSYINEKGEFFPCSFMEGEKGWEQGLDVAECNNFLKDVWNHPKTIAYRKRVIDCRNCDGGCPHYSV